MPALVLTSTPFAAARAARRLCDAEGGVLFGPAVTTPDRLVAALLADAGERRPVLTPLAFRLLAAEAGRAAGGALAGVRAEDGLGAGLAAALEELRLAEVTSEEAREAAGLVEGAARERLAALAAALAGLEARLHDLGALDAAAAARVAAGLARKAGVPGQAGPLELLVVDGLVEAPPALADLLVALAGRARRARFEVPFFAERPDLSAPAERLLRRLEAEGAGNGGLALVLRHLEDGRAPRLAALLAAFHPGPGTAAAGDPAGAGLVSAIAAAGEEAEPDAVARAVERQLEAGLSPGEVAVVAPAPRQLAGPLTRALAARGIPFAPGRGAPLGENAAVRAALAVLHAAGGLDRAAAERLAASTYLAPREPAPLASQLDAAGAIEGRGAPGDALRRRLRALAPSAVRARTAAARALGAVEAAEALARRLAAPATARQHAARFTQLLDDAGLRRRAAQGPLEVVAADLAALRALEDAADAVARAVGLAGRGQEVLPAPAFAALVGVAVEEAAAAPPPGPAAGAVELWSLEEAPALSARGVVVAGCGRAWPAPGGAEPVLRDPERAALAKVARRPLHLPLASGRRARALHRGFAATAAAREALTFTWGAPGPAGAAGRGGPLAPAVAEAFAAIGVTAPGAAEPPPALDRARTARERLRAAARAGSAAALAGTPLEARAARALERAAVERERLAAARAGAGAPHAGAVRGRPLEVLRAALPEAWSPSQLEKYAECPFRLFLSKHVRLPDDDAPDLDASARDEGTLQHRALELFHRARIERGEGPLRGDERDRAALRAAADAALAALEGEGRAGDPAAWTGRREVLVARLERFLEAEAARADALVAVDVEHRFGGASQRPPLELTAGGETVRLEGRIDRVDASPGRLRIVDYKSGRSDGRVDHEALLDPERWGEESFQVPAYLLAAARAFPGRPALEARYAFLRSADAKDQAYEAGPDGAPPGASAFAAKVVALVARIRAGDFRQAPGGCETCPWPAVCRPERAAAAEDAP